MCEEERERVKRYELWGTHKPYFCFQLYGLITPSIYHLTFSGPCVHGVPSHLFHLINLASNYLIIVPNVLRGHVYFVFMAALSFFFHSLTHDISSFFFPHSVPIPQKYFSANSIIYLTAIFYETYTISISASSPPPSSSSSHSTRHSTHTSVPTSPSQLPACATPSLPGLVRIQSLSVIFPGFFACLSGVFVWALWIPHVTALQRLIPHNIPPSPPLSLPQPSHHRSLELMFLHAKAFHPRLRPIISSIFGSADFLLSDSHTLYIIQWTRGISYS